MACVAPAPLHRIAHHHEAGDLVNDVVHPERLERGAVPAFMPTGVAGRAVKHAVDEKERNAPPRAPEINPARGRSHDQSEPKDGVADGQRRRTGVSILSSSCEESRNDTIWLKPGRFRPPTECFAQPNCSHASASSRKCSQQGSSHPPRRRNECCRLRMMNSVEYTIHDSRPQRSCNFSIISIN